MQEKGRRKFFTTAAGVGFGLAGSDESQLLATEQDPPRSRVSIVSGDLQAEVVDNHDGLTGEDQIQKRHQLPLPAEREEGRHWSKQLYCTVSRKDRFSGYNGISNLQVKDSFSPFLVCCSGLNCEFVFDASAVNAEPRWLTGKKRYLPGPSRVERLADDRAQITIEPGSRWGVKVEMVHQLTPPFFLDTTYRITPMLASVLGPWMGIFWASYLQTPYANVYYFQGRSSEDRTARWYNSQSGFPGSVVFAPSKQDLSFPMPVEGERLLYGVQPIGYHLPVYGGKVDEMLLAFMFQTESRTQLRFAFNPSGGGPGAPAWDFQLLIDKPQVNQTYQFRTRTVYKKFTALEEMLDLYQQWQ